MIRINLRTILKHDTSAIFILRVIFICITLWSPIAKPSARRMIRNITKWSITQSVSEKQENYPVTKKTRSIIRSTDYALRKHLSYPTVKGSDICHWPNNIPSAIWFGYMQLQ